MRERKDADCPRDTLGPWADSLNGLHQILNCAAVHSCRECVGCSEAAMDRLLGLIRCRAAE